METVNVTLFVKSIFTDIIKDLEMRRWSWIIRVGSKYHPKCPCWRDAGESWYTQRRKQCEEVADGDLKMLTLKPGVMRPQGKECLHPLKFERDKVQTLSCSSFWKEYSLVNTLLLVQWHWFQASGLQNCERINFYCLKSLSLWWFVMAATGNNTPH